jgi:hypothetical protein
MACCRGTFKCTVARVAGLLTQRPYHSLDDDERFLKARRDLASERTWPPVRWQAQTIVLDYIQPHYHACVAVLTS